MSHTFLSANWFLELEEIKRKIGDLKVSSTLEEFVLNITVTGVEGTAEMHMNLSAGSLNKGLMDNALTHVTLPVELAQRLFVENDRSAGMQGFMSGQIQVDGDMGQLMAIQNIEPSEQQIALQRAILKMTTL